MFFIRSEAYPHVKFQSLMCLVSEIVEDPQAASRRFFKALCKNLGACSRPMPSLQPVLVLSDSSSTDAEIVPPRPAARPRQSQQRGRPSRPSSSQVLPAVEFLTESSSEQECDPEDSRVRRGKRKRTKVAGLATLKDRLTNEVHCKALLLRKCFSCRRRCLSRFLSNHNFQKLMEFRKLWSETHKLDQDRMAFWTI